MDESKNYQNMIAGKTNSVFLKNIETKIKLANSMQNHIDIKLKINLYELYIAGNCKSRLNNKGGVWGYNLCITKALLIYLSKYWLILTNHYYIIINYVGIIQFMNTQCSL